MKKIVHPAQERGVAEHGWLHSRFSFSFADWYDPTRMGFGKLRVLNDDIIEPQSGFGMHGHDNMEIITIVTQGAVSHTDSMGNTYTVPAGDVQVMSAGTGVMHSEMNESPDTPLALFQIWIEPYQRDLKPGYAQKSFGFGKNKNTLELLVSPQESGDALVINQNAHIYYGDFEKDATITHALKDQNNGVYLLVISGGLMVADQKLGPRDAIGIWETDTINIIAQEPSKILLLEVPMN